MWYSAGPDDTWVIQGDNLVRVADSIIRGGHTAELHRRLITENPHLPAEVQAEVSLAKFTSYFVNVRRAAKFASAALGPESLPTAIVVSPSGFPLPEPVGFRRKLLAYAVDPDAILMSAAHVAGACANHGSKDLVFPIKGITGSAGPDGGVLPEDKTALGILEECHHAYLAKVMNREMDGVHVEDHADHPIERETADFLAGVVDRREMGIRLYTGQPVQVDVAARSL